jgi:NAD+ diphosphatase
MSTPFQLGKLPALSRSTVDRQETLRTDPERLVARWPDARVVLVSRETRTPVRADDISALSTRKAVTFGDTPPPEARFLGEWQDTDYWTMAGEPEGEGELVTIQGSWGFLEEARKVDGEVWVELRGGTGTGARSSAPSVAAPRGSNSSAGRRGARTAAARSIRAPTRR